MRRTAQHLRSLLSILTITAGQGIQFLRLAVSSRSALSAEVLFLRKQLAFYQEHQSIRLRALGGCSHLAAHSIDCRIQASSIMPDDAPLETNCTQTALTLFPSKIDFLVACKGS